MVTKKSKFNLFQAIHQNPEMSGRCKTCHRVSLQKWQQFHDHVQNVVVFTHKLPQSLCCPACVGEVVKSKGGAKLLYGGTGLLFSDDKRRC